MQLSEFIVPEKQTVPIILVALKTHHISTVVSHNEALCRSAGLSADRNLLFWVVTWL